VRLGIVFGLVSILAAMPIVHGSDSTLRYYLSRSDLVVSGEITTDAAGTQEEVGVVHYSCHFQIAEVLSGNKPAEESIHVMITRFELEEADRLPELKKGCKCILFLRNIGPTDRPMWETSNAWFGFQRPSPTMAKTLKRLASEEKPTKPKLIPVVVSVRGNAEVTVFMQGEPIPLEVTIANYLSGTVDYHTFSLQPNDWNGETVNMTLVDIYRDGRPGGLFATRPKLVVDDKVSGLGRHPIVAGERLTFRVDARKWQISGGWIPGKYSVNVRVEGITTDEGRNRLSILSEPFEFEVR
jgi:hypothetical protein